MTATPDDCAREIVDVVPLVMRVLRSEMRSNRGPGLSVPHFRVLAYLNNNEGACLSDAAEHVGLRLPSMSTLIDALVARGLVSRAPSTRDRRRLALCLTPRGRSTLAAARHATQARLAKMLTQLAPADQVTVVTAMQALRPLLASRPSWEGETRGE